MRPYDPLTPPNPDEWLATDEQERIALIEQYHRQAKIRLPNAKVHAAIHAAVESQIAERDKLPVRHAVERLMAEGLDRHDALHAVGAVLAEFIYRIGQTTPAASAADPNADYYAAVERLTAESWRRDFGSDE